jgi:hypothetical protein
VSVFYCLKYPQSTARDPIIAFPSKKKQKKNKKKQKQSKNKTNNEWFKEKRALK